MIINNNNIFYIYKSTTTNSAELKAIKVFICQMNKIDYNIMRELKNLDINCDEIIRYDGLAWDG